MRKPIFAALVAGLLVGGISRISGPVFAAEPAASASHGMPATLSRADEQAIRQVVQGQLDAFAANDARAAFAYAAPAIQKQFGTALHFMDVVKNGYPVVWRPAHVVFLKPERYDDGVIQGVQMTDAEGANWLATYQVQRQTDGNWRIGGCVVTPNRSLGT